MSQQCEPWNYVTSCWQLAWAKANCPGYITNDCHQDGYYTYDDTRLDFFFLNNSADSTAFALKWAGRKDLTGREIS